MGEEDLSAVVTDREAWTSGSERERFTLPFGIGLDDVFEWRA